MSRTFDSQKTCDGFPNESDATSCQDSYLAAAGCFRTYEEVCGSYLFPRTAGDKKSEPRIDRLLVPGQKLIDSGWTIGPVGIECKKSGVLIGRPVSQALDYSRAVFFLPHGFAVLLRWVFLFPMLRPFGNVESFMAQNRLGWAGVDKVFVDQAFRTQECLVFGCGNLKLLLIDPLGGVHFQHDPNCGGKVGSR